MYRVTKYDREMLGNNIYIPEVAVEVFRNRPDILKMLQSSVADNGNIKDFGDMLMTMR